MDRLSFDDVLGTNYAPSYSDRCFINALVDSMEQELLSLNQVLLPLLEKRDKLDGSIAAHKALLTPARRVLPELVSEIFTHAITSQLSVPRSDPIDAPRLLLPRPCTSDTPLKLGRICRRWRQIALSTPSLWSAFQIPNNWGVEGLQEWIWRAGPFSLSFEVEIHQKNSEVLKLLASYQMRWKEVVLHLDDSMAGRRLFREFMGSLPRSYGAGINSAPNLSSLLLHAPKFKIVTPNTPFLCLREINVYSEPTAAPDFLILLELSPAVEVISAYLLSVPDEGDSGNDILTLVNLKDLAITEVDQDGDCFCLLERLDLPALERLTFQGWGISGRYPTTHDIKSLIHRSRPPLKTLRVHGYWVRAADITYCIPFLPNLSCLDVEHIGTRESWDGVVQLLTGPVPPDQNLSRCICPQLNEIHFGRDNPVAPDLVIKMILSRSPAGNHKLSCVTLLSCLGRDVLTHPEIIDCVASGLKFRALDTGMQWSPDSS